MKDMREMRDVRCLGVEPKQLIALITFMCLRLRPLADN